MKKHLDISKIFLLGVLFVLSFELSAQLDTTNKHGYLKFNLAQDTVSLINSLGIEDYKNLEYAGNGYKYWHLGNSGLPIYSYSSDFSSQLLPSLGIGNASLLYFPNNKNDFNYFSAKAPYARLSYWSGFERGQNFRGSFTQNINDNLNMYVSYGRINSAGYYFRQNVLSDNLNYSLNYRSKRYRVNFGYDWTKFTWQENGGLLQDSSFINNENDVRTLLEVNLSSSDVVQSQNRVLFDHSFSIKPQDSLNSIDVSVFHQFEFSSMYRTFTSEDQFFFGGTNFNTSLSDSSRLSFASNKFGIRQTSDKTFIRTLSGYFGLRNDLYSGQHLRRGENSSFVGGDIMLMYRGFDITGRTELVFAGAFAGSNLFSASAGKRIGKKTYFTYYFQRNERYADYAKQLYIGDVYLWDNRDFSRFTTTETGVKIRYGALQYSGSLFSINNGIFIDENIRPFQYDGLASMIKNELKFNVNINSWLSYDQSILHQVITSGNEVFRFPELTTQSIIYSRFAILGGVAYINTGIEHRYFSAFDAYTYSPLLGNYYLGQNQFPIGDFHHLSIFFNAQIGGAKLFLKLENALQGLIDYTYFSAPGYPLPDRIFRIGLTWDMFN